MTEPAFKLLIMNSGSTTTKVAVFENETPLFTEVVRHTADDLKDKHSIWDQYGLRRDSVLDVLRQHNLSLEGMDAVVSRGGNFKPITSGIYLLNEEMLADAKSGQYSSHPCSVGCRVAFDLGAVIGKPALTVDPPCIDEFIPQSRYGGLPIFNRLSSFQALNQKAIAKRLAADLGRPYEEMTAVVAHMGGGMSIAAHDHGRVIDVNNGLDGDGPMAPERAGTVPAGQLISLCFSGRHSEAEIRRLINGRGGLVAYLGTTDAAEIVRRIEAGDEKAKGAFDAMIYQIGKSIGGAAVSLKGQVQAIGLTGGLAYAKYLVEELTRWVGWIAPIHLYPGENEMDSLARGALRYLRGQEAPQPY